MANITISSLGLDTNNPSGGALGLFLTQFAGEVLTAYERKSVTQGRHIERQIDHGKSADFPVLGRKVAQYLKVGQNLDDIRKTEQQTQRTIYIDGLLTADCLIADLEDAMNHYDVRGEYSRQIGESLALAKDGGLLAEIAKEIVTNKENLPGLGKGKILTETVTGGLSTESEALGLAIMKQLLAASTGLDMNYVPDSDRVCYMLPVAINALINAKDAINKLYGGIGSIVDGTLTHVAGFNLVKCPHLTIGGITDVDGVSLPPGIIQGTGHIFPAAYKETCAFMVAHKYTAGTLILKNFGLEHARRSNFQSDQIIGKYAMGHGGLRPEAAFMGVIES